MEGLLNPQVVQAAGALIMLFVLVRSVLGSVGAIQRFRQARDARKLAREHLRLEIEKETLAFAKRRTQVELSWQGYRKFVIQGIVRNENACGAIASFYLAPHDGRPLPSYEPGQFLTFCFKIPGQTKNAIRCYSLSDRPRTEHYRITVKKEPMGLVSTYLHDTLQEGDILDVRAPGGRFTIDLTAPWPVVLIAGGVGVTPLLSMFTAIAEEQASREVWLMYAAHNGEHFIMREHFERLALECIKSHVLFCYSAPSEQDREVIAQAPAVRVTHLQAWIDAAFLKDTLPPGAHNTHHFYLCGPPPMMDALIGDLEERGVAKERIHTEAFGGKTVMAIRKPAEPKEPAEALQVTFGRSNKTLAWDPAIESLLKFAEQNGVEIEAGCCVGDCHTCKTAIKSGEVTYLREPPERPEAGTCLPCITVPKSNLDLDV